MSIYKRFISYSVAIGSTVIAFLLRHWLDPSLVGGVGSFFYLAVIVSTWYGGLQPGIVSIILSALAIHYFFTPPINQFGIEQPADALRLAIFLLVSLTITFFGSSLKNSRRKIEQLNRQLIQDSQDRLRIALNAAQMGMWDWNIVTGEMLWSPEHEQLFGFAPDSFDGRSETFAACLYPEDREGVNQAIDRALKLQIPYQHEYRVVWADGSIHWIEGRGRAFYGEEGQPVRMTGTVMAIDERKQAQVLLQQQFEQQRLVMEMSQRIRQSLNLQEILQTTVDEVRQFLQVDRVIIFQFTQGWGGKVTVESVVDEALAIFPFNIYDPCIGDQYAEPFRQGLVTAKADIYTADISPCHVEFLAQFQVRANLVVPILKNGALWGLLAAHHCKAPRQWQDSEIALLRQIATQAGIALQQATLFKQVQTELREHQQAEAALQESESLLRLFAQSAPAGIAMLDREMHYIMASQRWVDDYSLDSVESLIGRSHYDIFPEIPERWKQIHQRCLAGAIEKCDDDLFVRANGNQQWMTWEIHPWYQRTGEIGGIIIFSVDVSERKRAEILLQESEMRFRALSDAMFEGIIIQENARIIEANPGFAKMFGYSVEEVIGKSGADFLTPESLDIVLERIKNQDEQPYEVTGIRQDGTLIYMEVVGKQSIYQGQKVRVSAARDITQRKQAEETLRQSEARLRLAQEASNSGVWDWDLLTNKLFWSPEYYQLYGLDASIQPSYETWLHCIHPDDREKVSQHTLQALEDLNLELRVEFRVKRLDELRWFTGIGQVLRDETGQPIRMIGITIDITQKKQTELALQQLNLELEQRVTERTSELFDLNDRLLIALKEQNQAKQEVEDLYNTAPCGYHSLDAEGTIVQINDTELSWLGYTRDEVLNRMKFIDLITPDSQQRFRQDFPEFKQRGWVNDLELQLRHKEGSIRWVSMSGIAVKDQAGNFVMSRSSMFDITDRKQAEQELALQAVITRNMAEGICLVKADDATIVYANPKFEQMFGYGSGELNGQHVSIVNYASESVSPEEVNQSIRSTVLQNSEATYEVHNVKKDGTPFWCSATCSVFKHPGYGDVLVAVHQDITARKQAEAALQQQAKQKQLLWNITQAIRQSLELEVILNAAVTEVKQLLDVERSAIYRFDSNWNGDFIVEAVADGWIQLVEPDVCKIWEDTYLQEHQGGQFQNHEILMVTDIYTAGLQPCHIELLEQFQARAYAIAPIFVRESLWGLFAIYHNSAPHSWESWEIELLQQIAGQLAIAIQQSELYSQLQVKLQEQKQAEAVSREAERRWRSLLDNVQLIVVGLDRFGNVNYVNPFFLSLTGYTDSEILGKNWCEHFVPPSNQPVIQKIFSEVLSHNAHPYYQNSILIKSGEERFVAWNNTMLQNFDGNVIGTISIGEDITERQKVEQMKNEFIGIVSHELRTPLTSIQMSLGLLNSGIYAKKPEKSQRMIEIALLETNRLVNLVNDILDLERLESGRTILEKTVCQAVTLMQQAANGVQTIAAQQNITLAITPTDATVWVAPDTIVQTLTNLLSNAIKFSPPHSVITLQAERQIDHVLFQVKDKGRGIPEDKLETIFGRFQQVDASDSREKGGTGLGLPICRSIIERHGGKIWAESTLDEGSTFFFTLPLPANSNL